MELEIPPSTVRHILKMFKELQTLISQKSLRTPPSLSKRAARELKRVANESNKLPLQDITNMMTNKVSTRTIQRELYSEGILGCVAVKKLRLTASNRKSRLAFSGYKKSRLMFLNDGENKGPGFVES
ncbi:hypothetical protein BGX26_010105, partial [Mortierella sp. AD094]